MSSTAKSKPISRRDFLRSIGIITTGSLIVACADPRADIGGELPIGRPFQEENLPLPTVAATTEENDEELAAFLVLSTLLTGVSGLSPVLGWVYLQSLRASTEFSVTVTELLIQVGFDSLAPPSTLAELESTGIFENAPTRELADKITELWYTGIYTNAEGEETVATFVNALAWQTLVFTKPMTICGAYRFWTEPPETAID